VYGFSMRVGPDGKPQISEFGNTRPRRKLEPAEEEEKKEELYVAEREPLTDVIDCDDYISITLEIPGVEKNEIDLTVKEDKVSISVDTNNRRYFKEIPLSAKVNTNTSRATYRNGVLDITLEKLEPKEKKGKKVKIN
jgi:HSP20 family protein